MAKKHSYTITTSNNASEKEAIQFLLHSDKDFIQPDKEGRKAIMKILGMDKRYSRAFDLVLIKGHTNLESVHEIEDPKQVTLVELKTTKKNLPHNPKGFFFGATQNEFDLAETLGSQFLFCFVSLHPDSKGYALKTLEEMEKMIRNKRVQYQINLK